MEPWNPLSERRIRCPARSKAENPISQRRLLPMQRFPKAGGSPVNMFVPDKGEYAEREACRDDRLPQERIRIQAALISR